jgi:hypothetical protein
MLQDGLAKNASPEQLKEALKQIQQLWGTSFDQAVSTLQLLPPGLLETFKNQLGEKVENSTVMRRDVIETPQKKDVEITGNFPLYLVDFSLEQSLEAEIQALKEQLEKKEKQLSMLRLTKSKTSQLLENVNVEDLDEDILLEVIRAKKRKKQEEKVAESVVQKQ